MFTKRVNETKCIRYTMYKDTYIRIFRIDMVKGYREPVYTKNIFVSEPCHVYIGGQQRRGVRLREGGGAAAKSNMIFTTTITQ